MLDDAKVQDALDKEDPLALARAAEKDELERLKAAEELLNSRRNRRGRTRWLLWSQALVGYVALLGLAANLYQSWTNKQAQAQQLRVDEERWRREFDRAQRADKYRAFFETSLLATDI